MALCSLAWLVECEVRKPLAYPGMAQETGLACWALCNEALFPRLA